MLVRHCTSYVLCLVQPCPALPVCFPLRGCFCLFYFLLLIKSPFPSAIGSSLSSIHPNPDNYSLVRTGLLFSEAALYEKKTKFKSLLNKNNCAAVRGSVMTFRSSGPSSPVTMFKLSTTAPDMSLIMPVTASSGSNTNTDSQLKQSCTVAPANALEQTHTESVIEELQTIYWWLNADSMRYWIFSLYRLNSSLSPACIRATMVLVTDVPMFEPMMIGIADPTSNTAWNTEHRNPIERCESRFIK